MLDQSLPHKLEPSWMVDDKTFIFPDWDTIAEVIDGRYEEELLQEVYAQLGRLWVGGLRQQFGSEYQLVESNKFFLLSKADEQTATEALRFLEQCLTRIHSGLPFVPECLGYGKWPVLCLEGDLFYRYLNDYCSEDEEASATVGGVFLNRGYGHFAMPDADLSRYSAVFVHELTHAILHICDLPVWLDEAIAVTVENHITRECPYELTRELIRRHRDYWTEQNIQTFWAGHSFWSPDDGQELSYHLARFLLPLSTKEERPPHVWYLILFLNRNAKMPARRLPFAVSASILARFSLICWVMVNGHQMSISWHPC
jgi:hypothetical protein